MKWSLLLTLSAGIGAGTLAAQETRLEHFQCYPVLGVNEALPPSPVMLLDQFSQTLEVAEAFRPVRLCNPTRKIHKNKAYGINDPLQHLTFYDTFPQFGPNRVVEIRNQFGRQKLRTREPIALAVPTDKNAEGMAEGLDHFRCYAASGKSIDDRVGLSDQFILPLRGHVVLDPVAFCNPVVKVHTATTTPIGNPEQHLACYSMTRTPFQTEVRITNQFAVNGQTLTVGPPDTLCVPTAKLGWEVIPDDDVKIPGNPDRLTDGQ